ncbi:MAG: NAD(+)/NADH kinase [Prevotellaceae bacterium]|jgi:NAD+ kinase|nr:NAD(+)/NADH kinase [Prevotellaceae bacterium]
MKQTGIGLYGRTFGSEYSEKLKTLFAVLKKNSAAIHVYSPFLECIKQTIDANGIECERFSQSDSFVLKNLDCLLSIGGDGTFLEASRFAIEHEIPILGINFGRLGFLAQVSSEEIEPALEKVFNKSYIIEQRSLLSVYGENGAMLHSGAVNEVSIQRSTPTMLKTTVRVNGELMSSYWSDGILVSTPTGSTAYSLSLGGPVLTPENQSFVITPVAPHNLNIRPIIISDSSEIVIEAETRKGNSILCMDNMMVTMPSKTKLCIKKSQNVLSFIKLSGSNFFKTLHSKLNWGFDPRN